MPWRTDSIQAVIFTMPGAAQPDALKVWQTVVGDSSPDAFQRPVGTPTALSTATGARGALQLNVTSQLGRIDVMLVGAPGAAGEGPPEIADFESAAKDICGLLQGLLGPYVIYRLGMSASLSEIAEASALPRLLSERAHGVTFPEGATDCIYQYNLRKPFKVEPEIEMNRVRTWSSGEQQRISMNIGVGGNPSSNASNAINVISVPIVNLRLDINSATNFGVELHDAFHDMASEIYEEIVVLAASREK